MIKKRIMLAGLETTVTRRVVVSVVSGIIKMFSLPSDIYVNYDQYSTFNSGIDNKGEYSETTTKIQEGMSCDYDEEQIDDLDIQLDNIISTEIPMYVDDDIRSSLRHLKRGRKINMHLQYFSASKSKADIMANKLNILFSGNKSQQMHDIEYFYQMPTYILKFLMIVNDLKNNVLGTETTLEEYLVEHFDNRLQITNTLDADLTKSGVVIREAQTGVLGYSTSDNYSVKKEYDDSRGVWTVDFDYVIEYEKPILMDLNYEIMVYNQLLPKEYLPVLSKPAPVIGNRKTSTSGMYEAINYVDYYTVRDNFKYFTFPNNDYLKLPDSVAGYTRVFSVLAHLDPSDTTLLFNIDDIPNFTFKENVKRFLLGSEYQYVSTEHYSTFYFDIYNHKKKVYNVKVIMDENGNLRASEPLDLRGIYRVCFYIVNDVYMLTTDARDRLKTFVDTEYECLKEIYRVNKDYRYIYRVNKFLLLMPDEYFEVYMKSRYLIEKQIRYVDITYLNEDDEEVNERVYIENRIINIEHKLLNTEDVVNDFEELKSKLQYSEEYNNVSITIPTRIQVEDKQKWIKMTQMKDEEVYPENTFTDIYIDLFNVPDPLVARAVRTMKNYSDIIFNISDFKPEITNIGIVAAEVYNM